MPPFQTTSVNDNSENAGGSPTFSNHDNDNNGDKHDASTKQKEKNDQPLNIDDNISPYSALVLVPDDGNELQVSFNAFLNDAQAFLCSDETTRFVNSSCRLLSAAAGTAVNVSLIPVRAPLHVAHSAASAAVHAVGESVDFVGTIVNNAVIPMATGLTETVASSVASMILPMFGLQSSGQSTGEQTREAYDSDIRSTSDMKHIKVCEVEPMEGSDSSTTGTECNVSAHDNTNRANPAEKTPLASGPPSVPSRTVRNSAFSSSMRICDLKLKSEYLEIHSDLPLGGFSVEVLNRLTTRGLALAMSYGSNNSSTMPRWNTEGKTGTLLKRFSNNNPQFVPILKKEVLLWCGKMDSSVKHYGMDIPIFKSRGFVNMDPKSFTELFLDSRRIQTYNKYSGGRTDEFVLQSGIESYSNECGHGETKIVRSENKVPFSPGKPVILWNLMHARKLDDAKDGYIIVSRSVSITGQDTRDQGSEIIWGVNVLESIEGHPGITDLTCISQVRQRMVPGFVQHKLAFSALCEVYKNTRALCQ